MPSRCVLCLTTTTVAFPTSTVAITAVCAAAAAAAIAVASSASYRHHESRHRCLIIMLEPTLQGEVRGGLLLARRNALWASSNPSNPSSYTLDAFLRVALEAGCRSVTVDSQNQVLYGRSGGLETLLDFGPTYETIVRNANCAHDPAHSKFSVASTTVTLASTTVALASTTVALAAAALPTTASATNRSLLAFLSHFSPRRHVLTMSLLQLTQAKAQVAQHPRCQGL